MVTDDAAAQLRPSGPVERPAPGSEVLFRWRKWDGSPHWLHECVYLGIDGWGEWFGQQAGDRSARPGREVVVAHDNVTLVPATGDYAYTFNAPPSRTRIYIDIAWDVRWHDGEPTGIDMDLDVVRRDPDAAYVDREGVLRQPGDVYIEDRDEWEEHRARYGYPQDLVERLEAVALSLERRVRDGEPPFDEATAAGWLARLASLDRPGRRATATEA